jgi:Fur family transcriptional regulator, ferric uptake regulator
MALLDDVTQRLRAQGGRMTPQRRMILDALACLGCHPTAEEIFEVVSLRDPSLNLSTVYRTLRWLESEGLVSGRRFDDATRQERFDPATPVEHHHFVCSVCKAVTEFELPLIERAKAAFAAAYQVQINSASLTLYGICVGCLSDQEQERAHREETKGAKEI